MTPPALSWWTVGVFVALLLLLGVCALAAGTERPQPVLRLRRPGWSRRPARSRPVLRPGHRRRHGYCSASAASASCSSSRAGRRCPTPPADDVTPAPDVRRTGPGGGPAGHRAGRSPDASSSPRTRVASVHAVLGGAFAGSRRAPSRSVVAVAAAAVVSVVIASVRSPSVLRPPGGRAAPQPAEPFAQVVAMTAAARGRPDLRRPRVRADPRAGRRPRRGRTARRRRPAADDPGARHGPGTRSGHGRARVPGAGGRGCRRDPSPRGDRHRRGRFGARRTSRGAPPRRTCQRCARPG